MEVKHNSKADLDAVLWIKCTRLILERYKDIQSRKPFSAAFLTSLIALLALSGNKFT